MNTNLERLSEEIEDRLSELQQQVTQHLSTPITTQVLPPVGEDNFSGGRRLFPDSLPSGCDDPRQPANSTADNRSENHLVQSLVNALGQLMSQQTATSNLPKLPTFSADGDSMEWSAFLETFNDILLLNGWGHLPSSEKATLLRSSMNKRAADTFNGLPADVKQDFERAKTELTRIFVNPAKKVLFQNEFDNKVQGEKETLQDLVTNLRRLARRGYPEVATNGQALDSFVHRRFIEAIRNPTLRNQVRLFRRDTVDQTLVEAYRLEAALSTERERSPRTDVAVRAVQGATSSRSGPRDSGNRGMQLCFNCQKPGHFARDCFARYGSRNSGSREQNQFSRQLKD